MFLLSNDIPQCVSLPPVSYSSVQSRSAGCSTKGLKLFPFPFLSNVSDELQKPTWT